MKTMTAEQFRAAEAWVLCVSRAPVDLRRSVAIAAMTDLGNPSVVACTAHRSDEPPMTFSYAYGHMTNTGGTCRLEFDATEVEVTQ